MGRPKLLLPWNGMTVIGHLITTWRSLGAEQMGIVVSGDNTELNRELDRLGIPENERVMNPKPEEGMFSSIRCASRSAVWPAELTHMAITLGDQPHLKSETLRRLLEFAGQNSGQICQPSLNGRAKHPIVLPLQNFRELASTDAGTLKVYLAHRGEHVSLVEVEDEGLSLDLDTPEDYEEARRLFGD
jgi:molybdenum cofactor cytidylyltransferase